MNLSAGFSKHLHNTKTFFNLVEWSVLGNIGGSSSLFADGFWTSSAPLSIFPQYGPNKVVQKHINSYTYLVPYRELNRAIQWKSKDQNQRAYHAFFVIIIDFPRIWNGFPRIKRYEVLPCLIGKANRGTSDKQKSTNEGSEPNLTCNKINKIKDINISQFKGIKARSTIAVWWSPWRSAKPHQRGLRHSQAWDKQLAPGKRSIWRGRKETGTRPLLKNLETQCRWPTVFHQFGNLEEWPRYVCFCVNNYMYVLVRTCR